MSPVMDWRVLEAVRKKASNTSLRCLAMFMMIVKAVWRVATVAPFTNTKLGDRGLWNTHNKKQVCSGGFSASLGIYFRARLIVRVDRPFPQPLNINLLISPPVSNGWGIHQNELRLQFEKSGPFSLGAVENRIFCLRAEISISIIYHDTFILGEPRIWKCGRNI